MPILALGPEDEARIKAVVEFAAKPENHYRLLPGVDSTPPGLDPNFCAQLGHYRCVFSHTVTPDCMYRHLSVSIPKPWRFPHPMAIEIIAKRFGFTGGFKNWGVNVNKEDGCVVVVQRL